MIELHNDRLVFSFPEVHPRAKLTISFQRTLRIPDDGNDYPLPPGLGNFPLKQVDDFAESIPEKWLQHGGVMLPMYQSEALWLSFDSDYINNQGVYPFAVKIATGKINAITGRSWRNKLNKTVQNYLVIPEQPWLDGYCVEKGFIRQFVAMPLGSGYSAEEQITGKAKHGGMQIIVYPMKRAVFEKLFPVRKETFAYHACDNMAAPPSTSEMGLAPGGRMRQEIYDDPYGFDAWETNDRSRCFVHIANSLVWRAITKSEPPTVPLSAKEYTDYGFPWFEYYSDDSKAINGSSILKGMKSITEKAKKKKDKPLPENESVNPVNIKKIRKKLKNNQVREGIF